MLPLTTSLATPAGIRSYPFRNDQSAREGEGAKSPLVFPRLCPTQPAPAVLVSPRRPPVAPSLILWCHPPRAVPLLIQVEWERYEQSSFRPLSLVTVLLWQVLAAH